MGVGTHATPKSKTFNQNEKGTDMTVEILSHFSSFIINNGERITWTLLSIFFIIIGKIAFTRFCSRGIKNRIIPNHLADILSVLTNISAITIIFLASITIWRVDGSWLVGGLGLSAGTIIGFASSDTIGNTVAGLIILFSRPFVIGNRITINGYLGDVRKITLIYTTVVTPNLDEINIPNRKVLNAEIVNYAKNRPIRIAISSTVDYGIDLDMFKQKLLEITSNLDGVALKPKPYVRVTKLGKFAAECTLYVFTYKPQEIPKLQADLKEAIWRMYKFEGISLTTPSLVQAVSVQKGAKEEFNKDLIEKRRQLEQLLPVPTVSN